MKLKIVPIGIVSVLLGLLFDLLFYGKAPGVSVIIYTVVILGGLMYLAQVFQRRLTAASYLLMALILFLAGMIGLRASEVLLFFDILLIGYLLLLLVYLNAPERRLSEVTFGQYFKRIIGLPFRFLGEANQALQHAWQEYRTPGAKSTTTPAVIRGILLSLPLLLLFTVLLSSADPVFKKYADVLAHINIDGSLFFRVVLILLVTTLFIGAYALIFMRSQSRNQPEVASGEQSGLGIGRTEIYVILGLVELLFLAFVAVQINYFFGGNSLVQSTGFTYAEYARKGFFELIAVAAISMLLLLTLTRFIRGHAAKDSGGKDKLFNWLGIVMVAEVLIIMFSAHRRLSLYEQAYGFTMPRLLSHMFIVWLALAFAFLLLHIVRGQSEQRLAFQLFLSVMAFFVVLNLLNPDALIARQNISRYKATGKIDTSYLDTLSADAAPAITTLLGSSDRKVQRAATNNLYLHRSDASYGHDHWQSANLSRNRADRIYRANQTLIDMNKY